ncbi:MAG: hypothetical protein DDT26_00665 [Dehalococcoidia bacterium]|nr:hypothetical protein [Chloroflexota bacterium]
MTTPFNIDAFKAIALSNGLAKTSNFLVTVATPLCLQYAEANDASRRLVSLCRAAQIPGYTITTEDTRPYGVGTAMKIPFGATHDDCVLTFYVDNDLTAIDFFNGWIKSITPTLNDPNAIFNGSYDGEVRYYDEITADVSIAQYSDNSKIAVITLQDAFPINVSSIELSWDEPQIQQISVTFAYRSVKIERMNEMVVFTDVPRPSVALSVPSQPPTTAAVGFETATASATRLGIGTPIRTNFRFSSLSSIAYEGYAGGNEFASSIRQQLSAVQFGMSGLLNRVMGAAPIQQFLSGLRSLNSIASGLNSLHSMRNNLQNTINSNLIGVRSQQRNINSARNRFP